MDLNQVTVSCTDYDRSVEFYQKLGLRLIVNSPPRYGRLQSLGIEFETEPTDQDWLWREAYLCGLAGNRLCIYHAGENRRFPSWRI